MESIKRSWRNFKRSVKEFHTKKPHLEFFTALLTIPVLLTVIILNLNNLKANEKSPKSETIVITAPKEKEVIVTKAACEAGIGDIGVASPDEGDRITENPVTIDIDYNAGDFCAVVWSYRINGGSWSSYDDRSIALYNLPNGDIKFELRVKSVVNSSTKTLTRRFIYAGSTTPTPTPSADPTPTTAQ